MIDPSVFIAPRAIVLGDVDLGKNVSVWYNAVIRGDTDKISIGTETNIQDLTMIHADPGVPCRVGSRVIVGHRVILHGCTIDDECLIGMGAIVLNHAMSAEVRLLERVRFWSREPRFLRGRWLSVFRVESCDRLTSR